MEVENWRAVVGYEGLYEVSDLGRVRSLDRVLMFKGVPGVRRGAMKVTRPATGGYHIVGLGKDGVYSTLKVHRMVARAFLGEPPADKPTVNHIDFIRDNNRAINLEYCSQEENVQHSLASGRMHLRTSETKRRAYPREVIDKAISLILEGSRTDAEIELLCGLGKGYLSKLRGGHCWNTPDGRYPDSLGIRGSKRRRLSPDLATETRLKVAAGESVKSVALEFGVSVETVKSAVKGESWSSAIT